MATHAEQPVTESAFHSSSVGEAWRLTKEQPWIFLLYSALFLVATMGGSWLAEILPRYLVLGKTDVVLVRTDALMAMWPIQTGVSLAAGAVASLATTAQSLGGLRMLSGQQSGMRDFYRVCRFLPRLLQVELVIALPPLVLWPFTSQLGPGGIMIHEIAVILWLVPFTFARLLVVCEDYTPLTAIRISWHAMRGQFLQVAWLTFVATLFSILGAFLCFVGILWTLPIYPLFVAVNYDRLFLRVPAEENSGTARE